MEVVTFENIRSLSTASASSMWQTSIQPALLAYEQLRGHAVTPLEIATWQAHYQATTPRLKKREAARNIAQSSNRSAETIRRYI